jgi:hypothetical protein
VSSSSRASGRFRVAASAAGFLLSAACGNPVHDDAVQALGAESPGVPEGPLHRPGQPCLTCHDADGPAETRLSFAGTLYGTPTGGAPVCGATVRVTGADGTAWEVTSNAAGNFFFLADDFAARFPATTTVRGSLGESVMRTEMNRSGSCNECHDEKPGRASPGFVWVAGSGTAKCR